MNFTGTLYDAEFTDIPRTVYLVSKTIRGCKTIKDVLFTYPLAYEGLEILEKLPTMVDSGVALQDDREDMNNLRLPMFESFMKEEKRFDEIISPLYFGIDGIEDKIKDYITSKYKDELFKSLLIYWNSNSKSNLGRKESTDDVKEAIMLTCRALNNFNVYSFLYYSKLFSKIGIDLEKITEEAIDDFPFKRGIFNNFEDYVKYSPLYFKYHDNDLVTRISRQCKSGYSYSNTTVKISNVITGPSLIQEIKNIINDAVTDLALDVTYFKVGSDKNASVKITLKDIIKRKKGISNIPDSLKRDIMSNKFQNIVIDFTLGSVVE